MHLLNQCALLANNSKPKEYGCPTTFLTASNMFNLKIAIFKSPPRVHSMLSTIPSYVNDISESTNGDIQSFAEDTSLFISDNNISWKLLSYK